MHCPFNFDQAGRGTIAAICFAATTLAPAAALAQSVDSMAPLSPGTAQASPPLDSTAPLQPAPGLAPAAPPVSAGVSPQVQPAAPVVAACRDCGVIEWIREIAKPGHASGVGAVIGGVGGALLGNQIGHGTGRTAATVVGAVGGAVAGHQIEKHTSSAKSHEVTVRFDDGISRTIVQDALPRNLRIGDRVRVINGVVSAM